MPAVSADLSKRLVPDELRELVAPLLPSFVARPQGGGTTPCDERAVFTAVGYVLTTGCAWRHLPPTFCTSPATAHRHFTVWTEAGLWRRLHRAALDELGARGESGSSPSHGSTWRTSSPTRTGSWATTWSGSPMSSARSDRTLPSSHHTRDATWNYEVTLEY
ncbi:transposase [Streptomyces sp. NPDC088757]|uniref:transposase n=1 Tax=Streptomyces sp. NPDC088757 TaxID=3365889 RepID=UPI0038167700